MDQLLVVGQRGGAAYHAALNLAVVGEDVLVAAVGEDVFPGTREEVGRLRENVPSADVGEDVSVTVT